MKGLFYKDFLALKKEFQTFLLVTIGVVIVAILTLLSLEYGNMATSMEEIEVVLKTPVLCMLFIPMAFVLQSIEVFRADEKAHFAKVLHSMPLAPYQMVGARYLMVICYVGISLLAAIISAFLISVVVEDWGFNDMFGSSMTFGAAILLYMSVALFLIYVFSLKILERLQFGVLITGLLVSVYWFQTKVRTMPGELLDVWMLEMNDKIMGFLQTEYIKLFFLAILCFGLSYVGSVKAFAGKKGV